MPTGSQQPWLTARLLWAALLTSVAIYALVLSLADRPADSAQPDPALLLALGLAAFALVPFGLVLPRRLFAQHLGRASIATEDVPDPDGSVMFRDRAATVRVVVDPAAADRTLGQLFLTQHIVALALAEGVAVIGFVIGTLGFPYKISLCFFAIGALLIAARFPRPALVRARAEAILGVRFDRP